MNKKAGNHIKKKEEIKKNPDPKIDQDFEGYPDGPAKNETIKPKTGQQKKTADLDNKDGEKRFNDKFKEHEETDEQESDGSANAFDDK
jgi:2-methylcitrate dehydratase PrpD